MYGAKRGVILESKIRRLIEEKEIEESLRAEFEATLLNRVSRYLEVKPHEISPDQHFAPVSGECAKLYRDGHFYGCIALTQAVAEALVRFMCQKNSWRPVKRFEENVKKLGARTDHPAQIADKLLTIWQGRDDYHHLNPSIQKDHLLLQELASEKARLLAEVEREVFRFTIDEGRLVPTYPKYWDVKGDVANVFLRITP